MEPAIANYALLDTPGDGRVVETRAALPVAHQNETHAAVIPPGRGCRMSVRRSYRMSHRASKKLGENFVL